MLAIASPGLGLVLGVGFAWAAADDLARQGGNPLGTRSLVLVTLFSLLVYAPVTAYFWAFNPDWCLAYLVDSERLPGIVPMGFMLLALVSVPFGFSLAASKAGDRRFGAVVQRAAVPLAATTMALLASLPRIAIEATYVQFRDDFGTEPVAGSRLGLSLLWMAAVLALATVWTATALRSGGAAPRRGP